MISRSRRFPFRVFFVLWVLFVTSFGGVSTWAQTFDQLLKIDRLSLYVDMMHQRLDRPETESASKWLSTLTPEKLWLYVSQHPEWLDKFGDSFSYDALVREMAEADGISPDTVNHLKWEYPFLKRKLLEGYVIKPLPTSMKFDNNYLKGIPASPLHKIQLGKLSEIKGPENAPQLHTDRYISERNSRAIYWDKILHQTPISYSFLPVRESIAQIQKSGGKILGLVAPKMRNYNPIFRVENKDGTVSHVVTGIGGKDRLSHWIQAMNWVSWNGVKASETVNDISVLGTAQDNHQRQLQELTSKLETLPPADWVIIGQKAAFENLFRYVDLLTKLQSATRDQKVLEDILRWDWEYLLKNQAKFEKLATQLEISGEPILRQSFENETHSISEVELETATTGTQNKTFTIRLVSNTWGDEMLPIAQALAKHHSGPVLYVGTAGSLDGVQFPTGSLHQPEQVEVSSNGLLPVGTFQGFGTPKTLGKQKTKLAQVSSPFEETGTWLKTKQSEGFGLVEVEIGQIAQAFTDAKKDNWTAWVMVSDVVGQEGETLGEASSSERAGAINSVMASVLSQLKIQRVVPASRISYGLRQRIHEVHHLKFKLDSMNSIQKKMNQLLEWISRLPDGVVVSGNAEAWTDQILAAKEKVTLYIEASPNLKEVPSFINLEVFQKSDENSTRSLSPISRNPWIEFKTQVMKKYQIWLRETPSGTLTEDEFPVKLKAPTPCESALLTSRMKRPSQQATFFLSLRHIQSTHITHLSLA